MLEVRTVDTAEFMTVAPMLRAEDKTEWRLFANVDLNDPESGFVLPPDSDGTFTRGCWHDDKLVCVWGVTPAEIVEGAGWVWLVATPNAVPIAGELMRHVMVGQLAEMLDMYPCLVTACWDQNKVHLNWMQRVGFRRYDRNWVAPTSGGIFIPHSLTRL